MGFSRQEYWSGVPLPSLCSDLRHHKLFSSNSGDQKSVIGFTGLLLLEAPRESILPLCFVASRGHLYSLSSGSFLQLPSPSPRSLFPPSHHLSDQVSQTGLQQYVNRELPDVQAGFRKGRGTTDQIVNICWIIEKAREFQKNIY